MTVEMLDPVSFPGWDSVISEVPGCTPFHSAAWANVLQRSYGYESRYFAWMENGKPKAVIPMVEVNSPLTGRRGVSLAFTDYCEPLVDGQLMFDMLFGRIVDHARESGWKRIEMRGGQRFLPDAPASASYFGHTLSLTVSETELFSRFRSNTRGKIRKAVNAGVEITTDATLQAVKEFYRMHCLTRNIHGAPPQPFSFFKHIYDYILSKDLGTVVLARFNNMPIAGAVCFNFGGTAIYKYSASDSSYRKLCANNLVLWEIIKLYSMKGYTRLCLGRTEQDNEGLQQFKNGWGTTENTIHYYRYNVSDGKFENERADTMYSYSRYLKKLPNPIMKVIGHLLYRHIG